MLGPMPVDPDLALRQAAITRAQELSEAYDGLVPLAALRNGFQFRGRRISFGSFYKGIHRPKEMQGAAALTLMTAVADSLLVEAHTNFSKCISAHNRSGDRSAGLGVDALQALVEEYDPLGGVVHANEDRGDDDVLSRRDPLEVDERALEIVRRLERSVVWLVQRPGAIVVENGPAVEIDLVLVRSWPARLLSQEVLRAYRQRCTVCALRGHDLVQAAHIVADPSTEGVAAVVNGLALCAIHHLAYDRNLLGIDPVGVVHIARSLREERDGPMLREGLQGFHGSAIRKPRLVTEHPDPDRLAVRFAEFEPAA